MLMRMDGKHRETRIKEPRCCIFARQLPQLCPYCTQSQWITCGIMWYIIGTEAVIAVKEFFQQPATDVNPIHHWRDFCIFLPSGSVQKRNKKWRCPITMVSTAIFCQDSRSIPPPGRHVPHCAFMSTGCLGQWQMFYCGMAMGQILIPLKLDA